MQLLHVDVFACMYICVSLCVPAAWLQNGTRACKPPLVSTIKHAYVAGTAQTKTRRR